MASGDLIVISPIGYYQSWAFYMVPSARTVDTLYTNNNNRSIQVCISIQPDNNNGSSRFKINGNDMSISSWPSNHPSPVTLSFIIPPNNTYELISFGGTITSWAELS